MQFVIFKGARSINAFYFYEIFIHHELAFGSLIVYIDYVNCIHISYKPFNKMFRIPSMHKRVNLMELARNIISS